MAELSNIVAIALVVFLLIITLSYLYRITTSHDFFSTSTSTVFYPRQQKNIPMMKVENPFAFKLANARQCSLEIVNCLISSQCACIVSDFWGVNLNHFHRILNLNWPELKRHLNQAISVLPIGAKNSTQCIGSGNDQLVIFKPPFEIKSSDLGKSPRQTYPLVIIIYRESEATDLDEVVAMAVIVHLKDEECEMESRVLSQYLKRADGKTYPLKPLYIPDADTDTYENSNFNENRLCVVCQTKSITHVCLPCRHTCVCGSCFILLDKCPMCRSLIQSFFSVATHEEKVVDSESPNSDDEFPLRQRNV